MRHRSLWLRAAAPAALLLVAACTDPATDPAGPDLVDAPSLDVAAGTPSNGSDYYLHAVTIDRVTGPQTVDVPLAGLPWLDFMNPFRLVVVKSDSIRGKVSLDGAVVLNLGNVAPYDTTTRRLAPLNATSTLRVTLSGHARGTVTLWILGRLQPGPTITLETPLRSAMLDTGATTLISMPVRGRACDANYPITSLRLFGTALPVPGDSLCVSFSTTLSSPFGTALIRMEATNARGRTRHLVQSFVRADWWAAADAATGAVTTPLSSGGVVVRQAGLFDGNLASINDMGSALHAMTPALGPLLPATLIDQEPAQPPCLGLAITRRGYRVERNGNLATGALAPALTLVTGGVHDRLVYSALTMPVRVYGYIKRSCQEPTIGVTDGSVSFASVSAERIMDVVLAAGRLRASERPVSASTSFGAITVSLRFGRNSALTTAQQADIVSILPDQAREMVRDGVDAVVATRTIAFDAMLSDMAPIHSPALDSLGVHVATRPQSASVTSAAMNVGWASDLTIDRPRGGQAPARGPILLAEPASTTQPGAVLGVVGVNLMNMVLWSAWRGGRFDLVDLFAHPLAAPTEGVAARLRSTLPPVIQFAPMSPYFRIGWGDLRLDLTVDPSVFGHAPPGAAPVTGRAWATLLVDVQLSYDEATGALGYTVQPLHSSVHAQLPRFTTAWIDEAMLQAALEDAIRDVATPMVGRVLAALPLPVAMPVTVAGVPSRLRLLSTTETGTVSHLILSGGFALD